MLLTVDKTMHHIEADKESFSDVIADGLLLCPVFVRLHANVPEVTEQLETLSPDWWLQCKGQHECFNEPCTDPTLAQGLHCKAATQTKGPTMP